MCRSLTLNREIHREKNIFCVHIEKKNKNVNEKIHCATYIRQITFHYSCHVVHMSRILNEVNMWHTNNTLNILVFFFFRCINSLLWFFFSHFLTIYSFCMELNRRSSTDLTWYAHMKSQPTQIRQFLLCTYFILPELLARFFPTWLLVNLQIWYLKILGFFFHISRENEWNLKCHLTHCRRINFQFQFFLKIALQMVLLFEKGHCRYVSASLGWHSIRSNQRIYNLLL